MKGFDFEEERIKQEISKLGAKRVLLQLPEGLKPEGPRLATIVEKTGAIPIVSADPCYGACDLAIDSSQSLGVDLIVHFGHARMVKHEPVPTVYVEARATVTVEEAVEASIPLLSKWNRIGLATTVQHMQTLDKRGKFSYEQAKQWLSETLEECNYAGQRERVRLQQR